jgi:hypothetical protein
MEDNILNITSRHGKEMYCIALKHAIEMIKIGGVEVLPQLEKKLEESRKELENE